MDVDLMIRYSDDRLCEVVVFRPDDGTPLYRIVTHRAALSGSIDEAMREARRLYYSDPWSVPSRSHQGPCDEPRAVCRNQGFCTQLEASKVNGLPDAKIRCECRLGVRSGSTAQGLTRLRRP